MGDYQFLLTIFILLNVLFLLYVWQIRKEMGRIQNLLARIQAKIDNSTKQSNITSNQESFDNTIKNEIIRKE